MQGVFGTAVLAIVMLFAILLVIGVIDGNRFVVVREEFALPGLSRKCRFVMISDLHNQEYGEKNAKVIHAIREINPDFIVLAGDLVTSKEKEDMTPGINLVQALSHDYKIYYGLGNHESKMKEYADDSGSSRYEILRDSIINSNIVVLDNKSVEIPEFNIRITGLELDMNYFERFKKKEVMSADYMEQAVSLPVKNKCNILIAHNPEYFKNYAAWGADLVLSGHVHGGIMRIPLLGGVLAPSLRLFPKYDGGVFREGKTVMVLGRGLGSHTVHLRFFNPAELHEITLTPYDSALRNHKSG